MLSKLLNLIKSRQHEIFLGSCIVLVAIISYNLGQINSLKKTPISVIEQKDESLRTKADIFEATDNQQPTTNNTKSQSTKLDTRVVVSKNSNRYHYSWCSGAKRIKPENQIWFNSAQEAESRGYTLAGNCN
ncbi:MAG: hypothetical protein AAB799_01695 [Patescibacteria group bacterium]